MHARTWRLTFWPIAATGSKRLANHRSPRLFALFHFHFLFGFFFLSFFFCSCEFADLLRHDRGSKQVPRLDASSRTSECKLDQRAHCYQTYAHTRMRTHMVTRIHAPLRRSGGHNRRVVSSASSDKTALALTECMQAHACTQRARADIHMQVTPPFKPWYYSPASLCAASHTLTAVQFLFESSFHIPYCSALMDSIVIVTMMSHMSKTTNTTTITTAAQKGQINCTTSQDTGHLHHSSATLYVFWGQEEVQHIVTYSS